MEKLFEESPGSGKSVRVFVEGDTTAIE